jgi:hypothetical protein
LIKKYGSISHFCITKGSFQEKKIEKNVKQWKENGHNPFANDVVLAQVLPWLGHY